MADYIIHKAVSPDKVKKARRLTLAQYGDLYEAQKKYDGCCSIIRLEAGGTNVCLSRTGEEYVSMQIVAAGLRDRLADYIEMYNGLVLIGEAWSHVLSFSEISGEFRRGVPTTRLEFMLNDILTVAEFDAGRSDVPYRHRIARLEGLACPLVMYAHRYPAGSYGCPQKLCDKLVARGGYDGLILRDPEAGWERGRGTDGEIVKIKRVLSYDLRVIGTEPGKGKHAGRIGALVVDFQGKRLSVGTGLSDAQRERDDWLGKIVEVEAMDLSSEGLLREPRLKGERFDKLEADAA